MVAKARTKRQDDLPVRFGTGRAPTTAGAAPIRIGTKDDNKKRSINLGTRFTPSEVEALRSAFEAHGAGRAFAEFIGSVMMGGLETLDGGLSVILPAQPDPTLAIAELSQTLDARLSKLDAGAADTVDKLSALARHQRGLAARLAAAMQGVDTLALSLAAISEQMDAVSVEVGTALRGLDEVGKRKPSGAGRASTDEYSRKLI